MPGTYMPLDTGWYVAELEWESRNFTNVAHRALFLSTGTDEDGDSVQGAYCVVKGVPEYRRLGKKFDGKEYVLVHEKDLHDGHRNWLSAHQFDYSK